MNNMEPKLKIGIIGLGHASSYQVKALDILNDYFELTCVCDIEERKEIKGSKVKFYTDVFKLIEEKMVDAVIISVPNHLHHNVTLSIIDKVKSILLEKPASLNIKDLDELYQKAEFNNTFLHIAYHAIFAKDLDWFIENQKSEKKISRLGILKGFRSEFFDPYIVDGKLQKRAKSLTGSWIDSGTNALSVAYRLFDNISINGEPLITKLPHYDCDDICSTFSFNVIGSNNYGFGTINTNWTLGRNYKCTELYFDDFSKRVMLDHSKQRVLLKNIKNGKIEILADFNNSHGRMVNHYIGVLKDFYQAIKNKTNNSTFTYKIHRVLFI